MVEDFHFMKIIPTKRSAKLLSKVLGIKIKTSSHVNIEVQKRDKQRMRSNISIAIFGSLLSPNSSVIK